MGTESNRKNNPEWFDFIVNNIGPNWDSPISKNEKLLSFWNKRNKANDAGQKCKCGNDEIDLSGNCTKCYLELEDYRWEWRHERIGGWLCVSTELDWKMKQYKNGKWNWPLSMAMNNGDLWMVMREYFYELQNYVCDDCKEDKELCDMQLHHKTAKNKGGRESSENMALLCKACHHLHIGESFYD